MIKSKKYVDASKLYDKTAAYEATEAVALVKKMASAKFDETVEAHLRLGVDGRHADQHLNTQRNRSKQKTKGQKNCGYLIHFFHL